MSGGPERSPRRADGEPDRDIVERGEHLREAARPGERSSFVAGPTGSAPVASELRGDPGGGEGRAAEGGTAAGIVAGTAVAGPIGGLVAGAAGAAAGSATDNHAASDDPRETAETRDRESGGR
jgi:hypothetical protein